MRTQEKTAGSRFREWLVTPDGSAFVCKADSYHITLIRVQKNADFDYLYCQRLYRDAGIERGDKFEYAGIHCKRDGLVYDYQYDIRGLAAELGELETRSAEALRKTLKADVCRAVEDAIGNDRRNLRITEISDEWERKRMTDFEKYGAPEAARKSYLSGEYENDDTSAFTFQCRYRPDSWTEEALLAYILAPVQYTVAESTAYIDGHQDEILSAFLQADMTAAAYAALFENPLNPVHRIKRIMQAVGASSAKTVNVTVCINDVDFTFKAEASQFRSDCTSYYSDWSIVAADRREFAQLFGKHAHYRPEDILRIEYARKVLYQAEVTSY